MDKLEKDPLPPAIAVNAPNDAVVAIDQIHDEPPADASPVEQISDLENHEELKEN